MGTFPDIYENRRVRLPEILFVQDLDGRLKKGFAQTLGILGPDQSWDDFATKEQVVVVETHDQAAKTICTDSSSVPAFRLKYSIEDKYVCLFGGKPNIFFNIGTKYQGVRAIFEVRPRLSLMDYSPLVDLSIEQSLERSLAESYLTLDIDSPMLFSER